MIMTRPTPKPFITIIWYIHTHNHKSLITDDNNKNSGHKDTEIQAQNGYYDTLTLQMC